MHYFQRNIGDYRRDTAHLSLLEHGVYQQLMDTYYLSESPLTLDHAELMRTHCARSADEMQAVENVLKDFFDKTENGYIHKRCEEEITKFYAKSDSARASAKARWAKVPCERIANAKQTQCEGNANGMLPNNPTTQQPNNPIPNKKHTAEYSANFEIAWEKYPKRPGANKKDSFRAWSARLKSGVPIGELIDGVARYAAYCKTQKIDPQYIKQPATFFGPGEHYKSDWAASSVNRGSPAPENFATKDYGTGVNAL